MAIDICYLSHSSSANAGGIYEIEKALASRITMNPEFRLRVGAFYDEGHCDGWPSECNLELFGKDTGRLSALRDMRRFVRKGCFDVVHLHNLWTYPSLLTLETSLRKESAVVVTINGMLDQWALANSKYKKKLAALFFERSNLNRAKLIQVNSEREAEDCRQFGVRAPITVIPNGIQSEPRQVSIPMPQKRDGSRKQKKHLLFLGRLHEKKGLVPLIEAWSMLPSCYKDTWQLDIVGWDDGGFETRLQDLAGELGVLASVEFCGALFGDDKRQALMSSDAFILPSHSEGLPMAVLEAWAAGLPTLISPNCNLPIGYKRNASLLVEPDPKSILKGLRLIMDMSDSKREIMGVNARALVAEHFSWDSVAASMVACYRWCAGEGDMPSTILL